MFDEEHTALNDDDQSSGESADAEQNGSDTDDTDATGGDTAGSEGDGGEGDGSEDQGQDDGTDTGDKGKPQMVPKHRLDEVIGQRDTERQRAERLEGQVEYLADIVRQHQSGQRTTEKQQDKAQDALDALIASGEVKKEDAQRLQKIIDAMGYHRGDGKPDGRVEKLERTVENLTKMLGDQADRKEKDSVLKTYGDIITEDDLDAVMKKWANSRDPEERHAAQNWSYEKIVKIAFHDKIVQNEVDKALKGKKSPAPKIDKKAGDKSPKKPQQEDFEWESGNGEASMDALKRSLLVDVASEGQ